MKTILKAALLAVAYLASVEATVDPCPQTDHLYYDKSCCDGEDQNCLDGILQTDKAAIDNLVGLKRSDGSACADDDLLKYSIDAANNFTGVVCEGAGGGGGGSGFTLHVDATGYSSADVLTQQECWDNRAALLTDVLALRSDTTVTSWTNLAANAAGLTNSDSSFPKGCYIKIKTSGTPHEYQLFYNADATGADPGASGIYDFIGINK